MSKACPPGWDDPQALAQYYRDMREARRPGDPSRWILLIKELRVTHGCGILDAERIALSQPNWRRWVEQRINSDPNAPNQHGAIFATMAPPLYWKSATESSGSVSGP